MDVSIRDICAEDVPTILNYWYRSPPGFIESIGADPNKLLPEDEFKSVIEQKIEKNLKLKESKLNVVAICYKSKLVGFHSLNPVVENDYGVFHAHIVDSKHRNKGVCKLSYPLACKLFVGRFNLEKIVFKTPVQNIGAIKVKEYLGIRHLKEEQISFGIIKEDTIAKVFELSADELK